jgi:hypothetical protein
LLSLRNSINGGRKKVATPTVEGGAWLRPAVASRLNLKIAHRPNPNRSAQLRELAKAEPGPSACLLLLDRRQNLLLVLQNRSLIFFDRFLIRLDLPLVPENCFLVLQNLFLIRKNVAL